MADTLNVIVEFRGGAELLFQNIKQYHIPLKKNESEKWTMKSFIKWMAANWLKERRELFVQGESVRPGILVLINNIDWELLGNLDYELNEKDCICFISTLHGG